MQVISKILVMGVVCGILSGCGGGGSGGAPLPAVTSQAPLSDVAPTISATYPSANATGISTGTKVTVTFSGDQDAATLSSSTFYLVGVTGAVTYDPVNRTASFTPASPLQPATRYTAMVTTGVKSATGVSLPAAFSWSFTSGADADQTPPTIMSVNPAAAASGVPCNEGISAIFGEQIDPASITTATFLLRDGANVLVTGAVNYSGKTAIFVPSAQLQQNTTYTATITTGVADLSGNHLATEYVWSFVTGGQSNTAALAVLGTTPAANASAVPLNRALVAAFNAVTMPGTVTTKTFTLQKGSQFVQGSVNCIGSTALFVPNGTLQANTVYTAILSTDVKDVAGNGLASAYSWTFTTGTENDLTAALVSQTQPLSGATGVLRSTPLQATFDEDMNPFLVGAVDGMSAVVTFDYLQRTYSLLPTNPLHANTRYNSVIRATDLAGNVTTYSWHFTTGGL